MDKTLIKINLLPENLRPKKYKKISVSPQKVTSFVFMGLGVLVAINIIIISIGFALKINVNTLNKKFKRFKPGIQEIKKLETQLKEFRGKSQLTEELISDRILWSEKMQIISNTAPQGIWIRSMSIKANSFNIDGTCVSLNGEEMNIIGSFINGLKENKEFFSDFNKLEVRSVQRRVIGSIEVADFFLIGSLKK